MIVVSFVTIVILSASPAIGQSTYQSDETRISQKILNNCKKCVFAVHAYVKVQQENSQPDGSGKNYKWQRNVGTAIPLDSQGHLVTLSNVVDKAEKIVIITESGEKIRAQLIGTDATGCVSVLKVDGKYITEIPSVISCHTMQPKDMVYFLGILPGASLTVHSASVENVNYDDGTFEAKAAAVPGTSGTPVFDKNENVLGLLAYHVDSEKTTPVDTMPSFLCISHEHASILAQQVISQSEPKCGWLGICIDLTNSQSEGIVITNVIAGSPADRSNLKANDKICEYNGYQLKSIRDFSDAFTKTKAGEKVSLKIMRGDSLMAVDVTLKGRGK